MKNYSDRILIQQKEKQDKYALKKDKEVEHYQKKWREDVLRYLCIFVYLFTYHSLTRRQHENEMAKDQNNYDLFKQVQENRNRRQQEEAIEEQQKNYTGPNFLSKVGYNPGNTFLERIKLYYYQYRSTR